MTRWQDTLTVFRQDGKRGFLNVYNGKIEIEAQFDRAWFFSEGLGGVVKDGRLGFVNRSGELVVPYTFAYDPSWENTVDFLLRADTAPLLVTIKTRSDRQIRQLGR